MNPMRLWAEAQRLEGPLYEFGNLPAASVGTDAIVLWAREYRAVALTLARIGDFDAEALWSVAEMRRAERNGVEPIGYGLLIEAAWICAESVPRGRRALQAAGFGHARNAITEMHTMASPMGWPSLGDSVAAHAPR